MSGRILVLLLLITILQKKYMWIYTAAHTFRGYFNMTEVSPIATLQLFKCLPAFVQGWFLWLHLQCVCRGNYFNVNFYWWFNLPFWNKVLFYFTCSAVTNICKEQKAMPYSSGGWGTAGGGTAGVPGEGCCAFPRRELLADLHVVKGIKATDLPATLFSIQEGRACMVQTLLKNR